MTQLHPTFDDVPEIKHPFADYCLTDALHLATGNRSLCLKPAPTSLEEAREVVREMQARSSFTWITGMTALDVLDAAIDGRDLAQSSRMVSRDSLDTMQIKRGIADRLVSLGWEPVSEFDMQHALAVATRTYKTYVGNKTAIAYLETYENDLKVTGHYLSEGRNVLSTTSCVIPRGLILEEIKSGAERFSQQVDAVVAESYAMRLTRDTTKGDEK